MALCRVRLSSSLIFTLVVLAVGNEANMQVHTNPFLIEIKLRSTFCEINRKKSPNGKKKLLFFFLEISSEQYW